jgi:hypothetical protein
VGFKPVEFDGFKREAGLNSFTLTPTQCIASTGAIDLISKAGLYGGTYAQKDIASEGAEFAQLGCDIQRNLAKVNDHIHTAAINENLIPDTL